MAVGMPVCMHCRQVIQRPHKLTPSLHLSLYTDGPSNLTAYIVCRRMSCIERVYEWGYYRYFCSHCLRCSNTYTLPSLYPHIPLHHWEFPQQSSLNFSCVQKFVLTAVRSCIQQQDMFTQTEFHFQSHHTSSVSLLQIMLQVYPQTWGF